MAVDARPAAEAINKWKETADAIVRWQDKAALRGQGNGGIGDSRGSPPKRRMRWGARYYERDFPRVTWQSLAEETVRCGGDGWMPRGGPTFNYDGHRMIRWQDAGKKDEYDLMTGSLYGGQKPQLQQVQFDDARGARAFWEMVCRVQGVEVNGGRGVDGQPAASGAQEDRHPRLRSPGMWDTCLEAAEFHRSLWDAGSAHVC